MLFLYKTVLFNNKGYLLYYNVAVYIKKIVQLEENILLFGKQSL